MVSDNTSSIDTIKCMSFGEVIVENQTNGMSDPKVHSTIVCLFTQKMCPALILPPVYEHVTCSDTEMAQSIKAGNLVKLKYIN